MATKTTASKKSVPDRNKTGFTATSEDYKGRSIFVLRQANARPDSFPALSIGPRKLRLIQQHQSEVNAFLAANQEDSE